MTVWVLGDQLTARRGPVASRSEDRILMIEARAFARRHPYHPHKLTLLFAAMRQFRDRLRDAGRQVDYHKVETFGEGLTAHFEAHPEDELVLMRPTSHGAEARLQELVTDRGGTVNIVPNPGFLCSPERFDRWAADRSRPYRHEQFYRMQRRNTEYLMDGDDPLGGEWNYDEDNREFPGTDYDPPEPIGFEPDATTQEVVDWVSEEFEGNYDTTPPGGSWADPGPFRWPVTREQALTALDDFCERRLPEFGDYQDAMLGDEWALNHALLSPALNIGLLTPDEVIETALKAFHTRDDIPLNSIEGFVRQVLGWREFVRHLYRVAMPDLADANQLEAEEDLPEFYWTGETEMACLEDVIDGVRTRGYSHHIERLMVLSNFALLYGVEPAQLNAWFHAAYVDAYHWVTTPNVVEMGSYGSGIFATKPYAASANYIDRMSDHCAGCPYDPSQTTGDDACPFNTLYWEFLDRNEEPLRSNHRMGLMYSHLDRKDEAELSTIRAEARELRSLAQNQRL